MAWEPMRSRLKETKIIISQWNIQSDWEVTADHSSSPEVSSLLLLFFFFGEVGILKVLYYYYYLIHHNHSRSVHRIGVSPFKSQSRLASSNNVALDTYSLA